VLHVAERRQRHLHDIVACAPVQTGHKADAAGIVLKAWVVETLGVHVVCGHGFSFCRLRWCNNAYDRCGGRKETKNQLTHARWVWLVLHCKWCCALHYIEL
jgi:hypothetical protein